MNSEKMVTDILNGKKNILCPIFNELAYIDVEVTDRENCLIHLGDNYYIKTKLSKANEIAKRMNLEKAKNDCSIRKLDENTYEIRENIAVHQEEEKKIEKEKAKEKKEEVNEEDKEKIKKEILEENKRLLEKINQININNLTKSKTKRLKMRKKEDIIDTVLNKIVK